jgi:hypothetical protein
MRFLLLAIPLTLAGCGINVQHSSTGPGTYLVTAEGEEGHSHAEVTRAANDRAMQLCGPEGYQVQSHAGGTQVQGHANEQHAYVGTKGSVSLYIVCNSAAPAVEPPPAEEAPPPTEEAPPPSDAPGGY